MLQELPYESYGFQINDISFILKLYSVKGDNQKVMPVVDLLIIQGNKKEEATGFRIRDLHFFDPSTINGLSALLYNSHREDNGYNHVRITSFEIDYFLIGEYCLKFVKDDGYSKMIVRTKYDIHFESRCDHLMLNNFTNSIEMINKGIKEFFIKNNYFDVFFDKYSYDPRDPNHQTD